MKTIRTFIAIPLSEDIQHYLGELSQNYEQLSHERAVRWVRPENIHLTIRFLGDTTEDQLPSLFEILDEIGSTVQPFRINLGMLGCFPNKSRPRVIWVGVESDSTFLTTLHGSIEKTVTSLGWKPEKRKFHAHLTLGRVKDFDAIRQAKYPWGERVGGFSTDVRVIYVYESVLKPSGAEYSVRHISKLGIDF